MRSRFPNCRSSDWRWFASRRLTWSECGVMCGGRFRLRYESFFILRIFAEKEKRTKTRIRRFTKRAGYVNLYESPHRLKEMLFALSEVLGNRRIVLARELTKKFEEYVRGSVEEILHWVETTSLKGEFVVIVEGASDELIAEDEVSVWWKALSIEDHVEQLMEEDNISSKEAIKRVATERNLPKREVYQAYHIN